MCKWLSIIFLSFCIIPPLCKFIFINWILPYNRRVFKILKFFIITNSIFLWKKCDKKGNWFPEFPLSILCRYVLCTRYIACAIRYAFRFVQSSIWYKFLCIFPRFAKAKHIDLHSKISNVITYIENSARNLLRSNKVLRSRFLYRFKRYF